MPKLPRRAFLKRVGGIAATTFAAGAVDPPLFSASTSASDHRGGMTASEMRSRRQEAYRRRQAVALGHRNVPLPSFPTNGDETRYPNRIANFTKGLPHDEKGEVDLSAYTALLNALTAGQATAFEAIPLGGKVKFANPRAPTPDQIFRSAEN